MQDGTMRVSRRLNGGVHRSSRGSSGRTRHRSSARCTLPLTALVLLAVAPGLDAQRPSQPTEPRFEWTIEGKADYRDSEDVRFPSPFPFAPADIPVGESAVFLRTVDPGNHVEINSFSLTLEGRLAPWARFGLDVDVVDLHERNPTSDDHEIDLDEVWLLVGREPTHSGPLQSSGFLKLGKFGKFERQDDRALESYGLMSTVFNRLEDFGIEFGGSFGNHVYAIASVTQGNPVFLRDPNALAGDNGTPRSLQRPSDPELWSGIPVLYDAEVELDELGFDKPEVGLGVGFRWASQLRPVTFDFLLWRYERALQDTVELEGTRYGGDLDVLLGPLNLFPLPVSDDGKEETGVNLRVLAGGFEWFTQVVDSKLAGMDRSGFETEVAWTFNLPLFASAAGKQLFSRVTPAIRYSELDPEFDGGSPAYPSPSVRWDWQKFDYGVRLGIWDGLDVTAERTENTFVVAGADQDMDETLVTLRWRWRRR